MGWAIRHPELVRRIVLLNTAAFLSPYVPWRIAVGKLPWIGEWAIRHVNAFALAATVMAVTRPLDPAVRAGYLWPYQTPADRVAIARFVRIFWGGRDWCFDDRFLAGWLTRFPTAYVTRLDDAGHYVLEDASDTMIAYLAQWLLAE